MRQYENKREVLSRSGNFLLRSSVLVIIDDNTGSVDFVGKITKLKIKDKDFIEEPIIANLGGTDINDSDYAQKLSDFMQETDRIANEYVEKILNGKDESEGRYYEEKLIDGVLCFRTHIHSTFEPISQKQLTMKILSLQQELHDIKQLQKEQGL